jgi:hypothetical protein
MLRHAVAQLPGVLSWMRQVLGGLGDRLAGPDYHLHGLSLELWG